MRQILLAKLLAARLQALFHFPRFAVVLLQYIGRFQQLVESLLVEHWFVFLVGHDLTAYLWPGWRGRDSPSEDQAYFSAIPPPKNFVISSLHYPASASQKVEESLDKKVEDG